ISEGLRILPSTILKIMEYEPVAIVRYEHRVGDKLDALFVILDRFADRLSVGKIAPQGEITRWIEFRVTHHGFFIPDWVRGGALRKAQIQAGRIREQWPEDFLGLLKGIIAAILARRSFPNSSSALEAKFLASSGTPHSECRNLKFCRSA